MIAPPRLTVLMSVYNGERYLREAIESILGQTFTDFELLIIDDGSTDDSVAVILGFRDPRIRLVRNDANLGLVASLNRGLEFARGAYLARMDADDISMPERLKRQVVFMDANPEVDICGSWLEAFDGRVKEIWSPPLGDEEIKANLIFESVIYHPTVIMRQTVLSDLAVRYDEDYPYAQDYDLWGRLSRSCRFANIGEVLLRYRIHEQSIGKCKSDIQGMLAGRVRRRLLIELGIEPTEVEQQLHNDIAVWRIGADHDFLEQAHAWLLNLRRANAERGIMQQQALETVLARRWYEICFIATPIGMDSLRFFYRSPLSGLLTVSLRHKLIFALRALLCIK